LPVMTSHSAILIIGPTGAGKTPLGDFLEAEGLFGRRCHHFDFGANLRAAAAGQIPGFEISEIRFIGHVLETGALLENESFGLAVRILDYFTAGRRTQPGDWLIMNGLPRHIGQAQALTPFVRIAAIVDLRCSARTIGARLHSDPGGDRAGRTDDTPELLQAKLTLFAERTRPLLDYYCASGVPVIPIVVTPETRPHDIVADLRAMKPLAGDGEYR
jgi:adenylate kinase